jgi:hypothetical protein
VSITQGSYEVQQTNGTLRVIGHLGNLASGSYAYLGVDVTAPVTNALLQVLATVGATQEDLNLGDNAAWVTTTVTDLPKLTVTLGPGVVVLSWPVTSGSYVLQATPTLNPPSWMAVPQPPSLVNGVWRVTLPTGGGTQFYRLWAP